jgi:uncharacterized protein (TIGR02145 family)
LVDVKATNSNGLAQLTNLEAGNDYEARFYHDAQLSTPHGQEYWGKKAITITTGQTTTTDFTRYMPYVPEGIKVYANNVDVSGTTVDLNNELIIEVLVKNDGGALQGKSRLILDKEKDSSYDFDETSTNQAMAGATSTTVFSFTYTPTADGSYYYTINTQADVAELGGYLVTDAWAWSEAVLFTVGSSGGTTGTMTDARDGKTYNTVTIGNQEWMAENLAYLPSVNMGADGSDDNTAGKYYYVYGYDGTNVTDAKATDNYTTYGVLYNWNAAMDGASTSSANPSGVQGVCPTSWHLPSDVEWTVLTDLLGGESVAGGKLKETGTTHWNSPNTGATNSGLPGGLRSGSGGYFNGIGDWFLVEFYGELYIQCLVPDPGL